LRDLESPARARDLVEDSPCFTAPRNESSRSVTEKRAERTDPVDLAAACSTVAPEVDPLRRAATGAETRPTTSADALRLAIKLAVDVGEYERAAAILDVLRRTTPGGP
jgi:hypothetical protein